MSDYLAENQAYWDTRAAAHGQSANYAFERFATDPGYLSEVVRFDRERLGGVDAQTGLHLQCHVGTDTVSLARLGARMTGLDFSPTSLTEARRLAAMSGVEIDFHQADVYDAVAAVGAESFDFVYTGVGALCWLPDIARWAGVVAAVLRPGGRLFLREGHPMLWTLDETVDPAIPRYPYFEHRDPIVQDESGTYVQTDAVFAPTRSHSWNHGLGETITALMTAGMELTQLVEHDSVPWNAIPGQMVEDEFGEWRLVDQPQRLAATFTLQAVKRR